MHAISKNSYVCNSGVVKGGCRGTVYQHFLKKFGAFPHFLKLLGTLGKQGDAILRREKERKKLYFLS